MHVSLSSPPKSSALNSPRSKGCLPCSLKKPTDPKLAVSSSVTQVSQSSTPPTTSGISHATLFRASTVKEDYKKVVSDVTKALTSQDVAEAYNPSRQFTHLPPLAQNKLKILLTHLSSSQATPFLFVSGKEGEHILFSEKTNPSFRFVKTTDIPPSLEESTLSSLGKPLDQALTNALNSKLNYELTLSHSMDVNSHSFSINVYPYQNNITQTGVLMLTFSISEASFDIPQFSESLGAAVENFVTSISSKKIAQTNQIVFTIDLAKTETLNGLLKDLLSEVATLLNINSDIKLSNTKLFDNSFYGILNPTKYASKKELFDSINSTDFLSEGTNPNSPLSDKQDDLSYPYGIWLERPSEQLVSALSKVKDTQVYHQNRESFVLFRENKDISSILETISKDAVSENYKYSTHF